MRVVLTVGNRTEPFDRLIETADEAFADARVPITGVCQYGHSRARSRTLENVDFLDRDQFVGALASADLVVAHAGVGTIRTALSAGHRPMVMARSYAHGECINDHQREILTALVERGCVAAFATPDDLCAQVRSLQRSSGNGQRSSTRDVTPIPPADLRHIIAALPVQRVGPIRWPLRLLRLAGCAKLHDVANEKVVETDTGQP